MSPLQATGGSFTGIVLAAGSSRRMGRPKQLLPFAGRPLLQHVVDAAAGAGLAELIVVLGHAAEDVRRAVTLPPRGRFVVNESWSEGQSSSLACGLASASADAAAAVVLLGDQPQVTSALVARMIAAFCAGETPAVRPAWRTADGEVRPGHPVVLARTLWSAVSALDGDHGARALFAAHPECLHEIVLMGEPLHDVDDLDDYRRVLDAAAPASTGG
jgi:molybdenum cofactor cytidylyltransferase